MDETIDLRPYIEALIRYFWVIIGAIILALLVVYLTNFSSNTYNALALVSIPDPTMQVQFDARIKDVVDPESMLAIYPELAMSDEVLSRVLTRLQGSQSDTDDLTVDQLKSIIWMRTVGSPQLFRLNASHEEPVMAANIANAWAEEFVFAVESAYGSNDLEFYSGQLEQAAAELQAANDALVAFQTTNRQGIVDNELASLHEQHRAYLTKERSLTLILNDIRDLRAQLEANTTDTVSTAEQLAALMLQLRTYESVPPAVQTFAETMAVAAPGRDSQWQFSIGTDATLTTADRAQQLQMLESLRVAIEASLANIDAQRTALEGSIFTLQTEKQDLFNEGERLISNRTVAEETYLSLARKVDESRIVNQAPIAHIVSHAAVPEQPARPNLITSLLLYGGVAALISAAFIIALTWWRRASTA
jgi:capsular polysaccharide biosynthesis protein